MDKLNSLHIDIAKILADYAKNKATISYSDLCKMVNYPSPRTIGIELEKVSLIAYEKYGVFISVLVVKKDTQGCEIPMPGNGFTKMYETICGKTVNKENAIRAQQEKAFAQDWSELIDIIRGKIKESELVKA